MATLSCQCGQVEILFSSTLKPKTHHECCCSDCRKRLTFLQSKGGPAVPSKPNLTVKTLDNKFVVVKGKENLYLYKLTRDSQLVNMACSCCHTFLMARHGAYHGSGTVAIMADVAVLNNIDNISKPLARWFTNMCTDEDLEGLDASIPHLWVTSEGVTGNVDNWAQIFEAQTSAIMVPVPDDGRDGGTFEDIVEHIGKDKIIIVNTE